MISVIVTATHCLCCFKVVGRPLFSAYQSGRAASLLGRGPVESIDRDVAFRAFLPWVLGHEGEPGHDRRVRVL